MCSRSSPRAPARSSRGSRRSFPTPWLFALLLVTSCLTSLWKLNLPIPLASGSTLSVSYAANLMALLLLGPRHALMIALAGVWTQCTVKIKQPYPWYQTTFSLAGEALTMVATGFVYQLLGGPLPPVEFSGLARPLVGAITTYFIVNTGLVAAAIATTTNRQRLGGLAQDFSWSGASFMVAGAAGAAAAVVIARGEHWTAVLMIAPVYLTYKTYQRVHRPSGGPGSARRRSAPVCTRRRPPRCRWRGRRSTSWRQKRTVSRPRSPN